MIKKLFNSMFVVFKYAPMLAGIKFLVAVLAGIMSILSIVFLQLVIDYAQKYLSGTVAVTEVLIWLACLIFAMLFSALANGYIDSILNIKIKKTIDDKLLPNMIDKLSKIKFEYFEDALFQDTLSEMSENPSQKLYDLFIVTMLAIEGGIALVGTVLLYLNASVGVAMSLVLLCFPMIWLNYKTADMMKSIYKKQSRELRYMNYLNKLLTEKHSLLELRVFNALQYVNAKIDKIVKSVLSERIKVKIIAHNYYLGGILLSFIWLVIVFVILGNKLTQGVISIGVFTALITSAKSTLDKADVFYRHLQKVRWHSMFLEHFELFMSFEDIVEGNEIIIDPDNLTIEFQDVYFKYPRSEQMILKGVSFIIYPEEHVGFVGRNGVGKSTIIKLLCQFYKPTSGRILINGQDIQDIKVESLRKVFSVVFQDYFRYEFSLRENIALGNIERINEDLAITEIINHEILERLGNNLEANLGKLENNGQDLSGGQWQRIAISRAMFANNKFIILDEPTASLDPIAESEMYHNLLTTFTSRGCILITHRLASAKLVDKIIVIEDGIVEEIGCHSELMENGGLYKQMYDSQSSWYKGESNEIYR
ncbi:MAG: ABC transporter ATP-binding protein [Anaerorhabdus sp.]